jgi:hypothetical protein
MEKALIRPEREKEKVCGGYLSLVGALSSFFLFPSSSFS